MNKRISPLRVILRIILVILMILVLVVGGYVAYVFIDYHRLDDNLELTPGGSAALSSVDVTSGKTYHLTDWNIGFAAYTDQFSFFMDGGLYSRAFSEEDTIENMNAIIDELKSQDSDFYLIQEVDFGSTRSYHVDQQAMIEEAFADKYANAFGINYDSSYLFYPITCPIGASKSGILTLSSADIAGSLRRSCQEAHREDQPPHKLRRLPVLQGILRRRQLCAAALLLHCGTLRFRSVSGIFHRLDDLGGTCRSIHRHGIG